MMFNIKQKSIHLKEYKEKDKSICKNNRKCYLIRKFNKNLHFMCNLFMCLFYYKIFHINNIIVFQ